MLCCLSSSSLALEMHFLSQPSENTFLHEMPGCMGDGFALTPKLQGISRPRIRRAGVWSPETQGLKKFLPQARALGDPQISNLDLACLADAAAVYDDRRAMLTWNWDAKTFQKSKHMQEKLPAFPAFL